MKNKIMCTLFLAMFLSACKEENHFGTGWDEFNLNGKSKRVTTILTDADDVYSKEELEFTPEGHVRHVKRFNSDTLQSKIEYFYNSNGRIDSTVEVSIGNSIKTKSTYDYSKDKIGQRIKKWVTMQTVEHWQNGRLISEEFKNSSNGVSNHVTYEYDQNRNQINVKYHQKTKDSPVSLVECNFEITELDKQKNWIFGKEVCTLDNNPPHAQYTIKRIIEYF